MYSISQAGDFCKNGADIYKKIRAPRSRDARKVILPIVCTMISDEHIPVQVCYRYEMFRYPAQFKYNIFFLKRQ